MKILICIALLSLAGCAGSAAPETHKGKTMHERAAALRVAPLIEALVKYHQTCKKATISSGNGVSR